MLEGGEDRYSGRRSRCVAAGNSASSCLRPQTEKKRGVRHPQTCVRRRWASAPGSVGQACWESGAAGGLRQGGGELSLSGGFACEPCLSQCGGGSFLHPLTVAPPAGVCQVLGAVTDRPLERPISEGRQRDAEPGDGPPAASVPGQLSEACWEERPADMVRPAARTGKRRNSPGYVRAEPGCGEAQRCACSSGLGLWALVPEGIGHLSLIFKNQKFVIYRNLAKNKVLFHLHIATFKMSAVDHFL